tara:strand:- start:111 stop:533 length:423 start_codon:yes stop_codon:yes gene_type:complete
MVERAAANIITYMNTNIFDTPRVDSKIREEVPFFRKILEDNINNEEVFHGYINKINETWGVILNSKFKRLIAHYNEKYNISLLTKMQQQNDMIRMAEQYNADQLFTDLEDLSLRGGGINFLTNSFKASGISKKKISKKKK